MLNKNKKPQVNGFKRLWDGIYKSYFIVGLT